MKQVTRAVEAHSAWKPDARAGRGSRVAVRPVLARPAIVLMMPLVSIFLMRWLLASAKIRFPALSKMMLNGKKPIEAAVAGRRRLSRSPQPRFPPPEPRPRLAGFSL
jgi:hypothetical protein